MYINLFKKCIHYMLLFSLYLLEKLQSIFILIFIIEIKICLMKNIYSIYCFLFLINYNRLYITCIWEHDEVQLQMSRTLNFKETFVQKPWAERGWHKGQIAVVNPLCMLQSSLHTSLGHHALFKPNNRSPSD